MFTLLTMSNNLRNQKHLKKFGLHVRNLRKNKGLTMEELAYASEIEYSQISRIERGVTNVTLTTIIAIASGLETTIENLFKDSGF